MTETPIEVVTEQGWLGNGEPEYYLHNGHRLRPHTTVGTQPLVSLSRPFESAGAMVLLRNLVNAEAARNIAKATALRAEEALKVALAAEEEAEHEAIAAADAMVEFAREAAAQ